MDAATPSPLLAPAAPARRWPFAYTRAEARRDLIAGLTVAAISLPQGMAYALLAGVDPQYGLYSAIVVTAVASIFGSSSHLINGPTSAISLVVFSALAGFDPDARIEAAEGMFLLGVMVGSIQILIAVFKLGDLTRYISESVILGFMVGAALLLAIGQVGNLLGVRDHGTGNQNILLRLWLTLTEGDPVNAKAVALSAATIVLALLARRAVRVWRLPQMDMLVVLVLIGAAAFGLGWSLPGAGGHPAVAVTGAVPATLPTPHIPEIKFAWIADLSSGAFAVAFLGLIEALAIAKSIATQTHQKLDYNRQCMAEGIANLIGGFFRCLPGSGSLSRSAINFQAGAATRMSGIVTAVAVAAGLIVLAPLTRYIPKAALAGLLVLTAWRLIDLPRLRYAFRASAYDAGLVVVTALTGVFVGLDQAILVGFGLSVLLFVPRAARLKGAELVVSAEGVVRGRLPGDPPCTAVLLYDLEGEFFFGAAPELDRHLEIVQQRAEAAGIAVIVLRLKRIRNPDAVCLERLDHFLRISQANGITVLLAGVRPDLLAAVENLGFAAWYPFERMFPQGDDDADSATRLAVRRAYELIGENNVCPHCVAGPWAVRREREVSLYYLV